MSAVSLLYVESVAMLYAEPRSFDERLPALRGAPRTVGDTVVDPAPGPDELFARVEQRELVARGLRALRSRDLLAVIALKYLAGWSRAEIARVLNVPPQRVNVLERAGLERMRAALSGRAE
jgi:DNA-directed RNA polymerase specialized sigma24 family protein